MIVYWFLGISWRDVPCHVSNNYTSITKRIFLRANKLGTRPCDNLSGKSG